MQAQREAKDINDNWEFRKPGDAQWEPVNLPHTFNLDAYRRQIAGNSNGREESGSAAYRALAPP